MTTTRLVPTLALLAILAPVARGQEQAPLTSSDPPPAPPAPAQQPVPPINPVPQQPAYGQPPQGASTPASMTFPNSAVQFAASPPAVAVQQVLAPLASPLP